MLLGGKRAGALAEKLAPLGFDMTVVAEGIGVASAIKLCRSVFIKGLEAIIVESYTLARRHGVERQLLASLAETFPEIDWEKQGSYLFSRVANHGKRRAEEMREAANTVREAGFERPVQRLGRGTGLARLRRQDYRSVGAPRHYCA